MENSKIYDTLKSIYQQNVKPHVCYQVLDMQRDGEFHTGAELTRQGFDVTEVYDSIKLLVLKGDLTRVGKKTKITRKGRRNLAYVEEVIDILDKMVLK